MQKCIDDIKTWNKLKLNNDTNSNNILYSSQQEIEDQSNDCILW